ncbi:IS5 family transposase [Streptomyces sp. NPDC014622]|uniref:IS5 family transposase n=1 Tax=Streptomyces sp. NPDC014622 TaxID=3364874 RepID=UPI0036F6F4A3
MEDRERHRLWSADGTWERLLQQVQAAADGAGEIDRDISVDSPVVRAHQHAAGARTGSPPAPGSKGGEPPEHQDETPWQSLRARLVGAAGRKGLGRLRGGFTSKIHLSADGRCRPLSLIVTPGQRADCTQFKPALDKIRIPRPGPGRPRKKPDSLAADKVYSNGPCREYLRRRGIRHTIPEKTDSQAARQRKGSRGGRPPGFDEERYKKHNTTERAIPRHRHRSSTRHLATHMIGRTSPGRESPMCSVIERSVTASWSGRRSCGCARSRLPSRECAGRRGRRRPRRSVSRAGAVVNIDLAEEEWRAVEARHANAPVLFTG